MESYSCEKCHAPLMPVKSGCVCPNGHGGIKPKLPLKIARLNEARIAGIPQAIQEREHYLVNGIQCTPGRKVTAVIDTVRKMVARGKLIAIHGDAVVAFKPEERTAK